MNMLPQSSVLALVCLVCLPACLATDPCEPRADLVEQCMMDAGLRTDPSAPDLCSTRNTPVTKNFYAAGFATLDCIRTHVECIRDKGKLPWCMTSMQSMSYFQLAHQLATNNSSISFTERSTLTDTTGCSYGKFLMYMAETRCSSEIYFSAWVDEEGNRDAALRITIDDVTLPTMRPYPGIDNATVREEFFRTFMQGRWFEALTEIPFPYGVAPDSPFIVMGPFASPRNPSGTGGFCFLFPHRSGYISGITCYDNILTDRQFANDFRYDFALGTPTSSYGRPVYTGEIDFDEKFHIPGLEFASYEDTVASTSEETISSPPYVPPPSQPSTTPTSTLVSANTAHSKAPSMAVLACSIFLCTYYALATQTRECFM
jgi:hypothetical protein